MSYPAGWYIKRPGDQIAYWWDGIQYTEHTSPLNGNLLQVVPDPREQVYFPQPQQVPVAQNPTQSQIPQTAQFSEQQYAPQPTQKGLSKLVIALIFGGIALMSVIVMVVGISTLNSGTGGGNQGNPTAGLTEEEIDRAFVKAIREEFPAATDTDEGLVELGQGICAYFDAGGTSQELMDELTDLDEFEIDSAKFIINMSITYYCSGHESLRL